MDKEDVVHIYNRILLSHKRNAIVPFAETWIDLETVLQSEVSQKEKNKYHMVSLICGILKKMIQMNLFTNQKQIHRLRKQTYGYQRGKAGEG